uniref:Papilin n=1 Tax=Parascaris univalens TaxID=6257 RepID=A0A915BBN9_PARUN
MDWLLLALYLLSGASRHSLATSYFSSLAPTMRSLKMTAANRTICLEPMDQGNCSQRIVRFFYNAASNRCRKFIYSGCGGNNNRFETRAECRQKCARLKTPRNDVPTMATTHRTPENECSKCDQRYALCVDGRCQCVNGFYGDGKRCEDINECFGDTERCAENAYCVNTIGSFRCECQLGYAGSGINCTKSSEICSQRFDRRYERQCTSTGQWEIRYYYDLESSSCRRFWYGGCTVENQNIFADAQSCEALCVHRNRQIQQQQDGSNGISLSSSEGQITDICLDPFDVSLRRPCVTLSWQPRFFYNVSAQRCQMFWYDESCEANGTTRNIFGYLSTCRRLCELVTTSHIMRHGARSKAVGKITAMFTRDNSTTPSLRVDRTLSNSISAKTSLPRFVVSAKLTKYPTTKSDNRNMQSSRMIYFSQHHSFEASSTRLPIRLGKISVTHTEYSESDMTSRLHMNTYEVMTTARTIYEVELPTTTGHPNKIDENAVLTSKDATDRSGHSDVDAADSDDTVGSNLIGDGSAATKENERDIAPDLDEGDVSKFDIGQQFSLQFATTVAVAVDCLDSFDLNLTRSCGYGEWTTRYYFNADTRSCQMFWNDGCRSLSKNNFDDLPTCQWKCEGTHPKPQSSEIYSRFRTLPLYV